MQPSDLDFDSAQAVTLLHPAAAKLYVFLLLKEPGAETSDRFRKRCGIGDNRTYLKALEELRGCGLIAAETGKVWFRGIVTAMVDADGNVSAPPPSTWESLQCRMQEADEMSADGEKTVRTSPFQRRRRTQVAILEEAWAHLFPDDDNVGMTPRMAKSLLRETEDEGMDVLKEMYRIALYADSRAAEGNPIKFPREYLYKTLHIYNHPEKDPALRPKQPKPVPARVPSGPAHTPDEDAPAPVLQPLHTTPRPTEEMVAAWQRGERPKASDEMRAQWKRNGEYLDKLGINWRGE